MTAGFDFIVVKDPHFMFGFRNSIRKYGWERKIDSKINQIIEYAKVNNIKNIFFTGDVFEKSKKKDWSFNQLQQNKERLQKFKNAGLEIYSNMGNHDYFDGHEDINGTVFGEMVDLGLINYAKDGIIEGFQIDNEDPWFVHLYGIDHHQSIDLVLDKLGYLNAQVQSSKELSKKGEIDPNVNILLMHSNITDENTRITDFTYNQLSGFNFDIIACGHWHLQPKGGPIQEVQGTHFLNPWNLTRVMRDYHVKLDEHKPSFIHGNIVRVGDEFQYDFKEIILEVESFSEAFNTDVINLLQELGKDGFEFFNEIDLEQDDDLNNDEALLEAIAKSYDITEDSIKIAKELL